MSGSTQFRDDETDEFEAVIAFDFWIQNLIQFMLAPKYVESDSKDSSMNESYSVLFHQDNHTVRDYIFP